MHRGPTVNKDSSTRNGVQEVGAAELTGLNFRGALHPLSYARTMQPPTLGTFINLDRTPKYQNAATNCMYTIKNFRYKHLPMKFIFTLMFNN